MKKIILLIAIICLIGKQSYSQTTFKEKIKNFDDICFCNVGLAHPKNILKLDNNMELLFALKTGKTLREIGKSGIKYTDSQIKLLLLSGLIEKKDSIYKAKVPILSTIETVQLREATKKMAKDIVPLILDDYKLLTKTLISQGLEKNTFSIFFAYVLDGLVWTILENNKDIEETNITSDKPFWDGTFWMIEPKRNFKCGTNSLSSGDYTINVNWSDVSIISVSNYDLLGEFLNDFKENGKITKAEILKEFENNGLFNKNGELQIPVFKADSTDIIYSQSENIAKKVVAYLINKIDYTTLLSDFSGLSKGQKITIIYHEIMWDIISVMEENGQIKKPVAFGKPKEAKPQDLKDLIFIVKD